MILRAETPTRLRISDIGGSDPSLELGLQYHDKRVDYELAKFKHSRWFSEKYGQEAFDEKLAQLKAEQTKSLLFKEEGCGYWTYTGLAQKLQRQFGCQFESDIKYPDFQPLPWSLDPLKPYPFQQEIIEKMLHARHCAVEVATGLGKSNCLVHMARRMGLQAVIVAPSASISGQLHVRLTHDLGKRYVGLYGAGRKDLGKLITVATAQSLTRIEPGSPA